MWNKYKSLLKNFEYGDDDWRSHVIGLMTIILGLIGFFFLLGIAVLFLIWIVAHPIILFILFAAATVAFAITCLVAILTHKIE